MNKDGYYIQLFSVHGLVRGANWEMGRNADTGGQVKYVVELAQALGENPDVRKVDLFTRRIRQEEYAEEYGEPIEQLSEKVRIVRIPCGGDRYIRKELLWPHLDEFVDNTIQFIDQENDIPDALHGHYADGGYIAMELANLLGAPLVFTGHSLGIPKRQKLQQSGMSETAMNEEYRIDHRIEMETAVINKADFIVTSTQQEIDEQYAHYEQKQTPNFVVIPPGIDTTRFYPFFFDEPPNTQEQENIQQANFFMNKELERFLVEPDKRLILALSRPDRRKNIPGLVEAYGNDKELQAMANLAIFAGLRKDINAMDSNEQEVLTELLLLMDKFDLYGKLAIPKKHDFEYEVPELYRIAARKQGVFINPAYTEPFGLTLIEAASSGLPIVATDDGGPQNIVKYCQNGLLVDVSDPKKISQALKDVIADDEQWRTYSQNGVRGVQEHYSWSAHTQSYVEELGQIVAPKLLADSNYESITTPMVETIPQVDSEALKAVGKRLMTVDKLFISDIDDTLIGHDDALAELAQQIRINRHRIGFGLATGRPIDMVLPLFEEYNLPVADIIISSVGTEIYYGSRHLIDRGWHAHISYNWRPEQIVVTMSQLPFVEMQPKDGMRAFKLSYFMDDEHDHLQQVHNALQAQNLHYTLIYSRGHFLDILPERASKGQAIRYVCQKWSIPLHNVLVSGDSDNDADMIEGEMLGVVVGNHHADLDVLRGSPNVYFSEQHQAAGILDGFAHYQFINSN